MTASPTLVLIDEARERERPLYSTDSMLSCWSESLALMPRRTGAS
jgi:hypothetical protein